MLSIKNQVSELLNRENGDSEVSIKLTGGEVLVRLRKVINSRELLIIFHSAFDRKKREIPPFDAFAKDIKNITQLSVSDPSMQINKTNEASWYAGHEGFESQKILPDLFNEIVEQGRFERVVFLGGSSGGFASLFYSSFIHKSVAIASVPQTNLNTYISGPITRYRENCWSSLTTNEELSKKIITNLCDLYSVPQSNTIIYIQSAGDTFHTRTQLTPFMQAVQNPNGEKFILDSGFWGILGHSGSAPSKAFLPWTRAALASPSTEANDILITYHKLIDYETPEIPLTMTDKLAISTHDLNLSRLIFEYQLRKTKE